MATLVEDARSSAEWIALALNESGFKADFTLESLHEIDRFFDENSQDGQPTAGGLLGKSLGSRLFAIGAYVGETIIRSFGGSWSGDDDDPEGEINMRVDMPHGHSIWPVQRVIKRLRNGEEDGIYVYGYFIGRDVS